METKVPEACWWPSVPSCDAGISGSPTHTGLWVLATYLIFWSRWWRINISKLAESSFQPWTSQSTLENWTVYKGQTLANLIKTGSRCPSSLLKELPGSSLLTGWMIPEMYSLCLQMESGCLGTSSLFLPQVWAGARRLAAKKISPGEPFRLSSHLPVGLTRGHWWPLQWHQTPVATQPEIQYASPSLLMRLLESRGGFYPSNAAVTPKISVDVWMLS